ncbi:MAG: hypothetical protein R2861_08320 [Desulfobacterales bacterium]
MSILVNGRGPRIFRAFWTRCLPAKKLTDDKKWTDQAPSALPATLWEKKRQKRKSRRNLQHPRRHLPAPWDRGTDSAIGSGTLRGEVNITADEIRNALIIEATPGDYQVIKKLRKSWMLCPGRCLLR